MNRTTAATRRSPLPLPEVAALPVPADFGERARALGVTLDDDGIANLTGASEFLLLEAVRRRDEQRPR